jgi:NodT family efflux transporter outer membrane factor (OMF) lipoprotein
MTRAGFLASLFGGILLSGCAGMPHKQGPVSLPKEAPLEGLEYAGGGEWPAADWWTHYSDATLDALITLGAAESPSLATAHARFESAEQSVRLAAAAAGAHVNANADMTRQRLSENGLFPPRLLGFTWYNLADLGLQGSYTFDWWGKQRSAVESAMDQAHAAQADRSAALLLLASSISDTYFGWQADQNRLALARETEQTIEQEADITSARVKADLEAADSIEHSNLNLAQAREQIASLEGSAKLRVVALAALVGKPISQLPTLTVHALPSVSGALPDDVKLDLIARRADITASRWRVEAAEKTLAAARAEFYPDVSINALLGVQSVDVGKLLQYSSRVPQIGAAIHLPIFDEGRLKAQYGAARAAIDSAVSTYQDTVVSATREVGTQITTLAQIESERVQRRVQVDATLKIKSSEGARVEQGLTDARSELTADEAWIAQRDALLQLDAAALSADIALQQALGGGYSPPQSTNTAARGAATTPATTP